MKEDYMATLRFDQVDPVLRYEVDQRPATLLEKAQYWFRHGYWVRGLKITTYREVSPETPTYDHGPYEINHSWFTPNDVY